jgi:hypothetical protein
VTSLRTFNGRILNVHFINLCFLCKVLIQRMECGGSLCFVCIDLEVESDSGDKDPIKGFHKLRNLQQSDDNPR